MKNERIIVIEDNKTMREGVVESLRREGYAISAYENGPQALKEFQFKPAVLAIIDLKMEPMNGIQILEKIKEQNPTTEVLMISAYGTVEDAVKAMKLGAIDFLTKPFSPEELRIRVKKIIEKIENEKKIQELIEQNRLLSDELFVGYEEMVGNSLLMKKIFTLVEQVSDSESFVLIQGESGTGKELIARAIHRRSRRVEKPFIKFSCGALNDNLLESELFGHEKGAFTGAIRQKKGRFELADGGTLFLDEVGDVSPLMQVKLLRVLQEGEFERVGGEVTIKTNVRIIAATNRDLHKLIQEEKFREDLYYRLSVIPIKIPPLRERKEDIPMLVEYFLKKLATRNNQTAKQIDVEGMKLLIDYDWPGNIRELENLMERLTVITPGNTIECDLIASHLYQKANHHLNYDNLSLERAVETFEKNLIVQALKKAEGVKSRAAKILEIPPSVLHYKLEKYGL